MNSIRIRQIAQVGSDYAGIERQLRDVFDLDVSYRDRGERPAKEAGVSPFGLRNFIVPIGNQFLETVSPQPDLPDSAGARYLNKRGGDGGYMVIMQVPQAEYASRRQRLLDMGVRLVADAQPAEGGGAGLQIHPKDLPGGINALRWCEDEEREDGPWWPTGPDWQSHKRTEIVQAIRAAEIQTPDPSGVATRWAELLQEPLAQDSKGNPTIELRGATIRFVQPSDGRPEGLGGIDLEVVDADRALSNADRIGVRSGDDQIMICGMRLRLV
jgi:hypothetical protein